jgi:hypothetical protein
MIRFGGRKKWEAEQKLSLKSDNKNLYDKYKENFK